MLEHIQNQLSMVLETHRTGEHETARADCALLLEQAPEVPDTHFVMALLEQDAGQHARAIRYLGRAIRLSPQRSEFHDALGVSQVSLGKKRDGLRSFAEAVRLAPENRIAVMHLGLLTLRLGLAEQALPCFESLMAMGETSADLLCLRGQALHLMDRNTEAVEWLHLCLDLCSEHRDAHLYLGRSLMALERYDEASQCLKVVIDGDTADAVCHVLLGECLFRMGELEQAEAALQQAIDIDHSQHKAHAFLGEVQSQMGMTEAPLRALLTALQLHPGEMNYRTQLGHQLMKQGFLPNAVHCFRLVLAQRPYDLDAIAGLSSVLAKMGDHEGALAIAQPMIEAGADHPDLAHIYASLCRKLGRSHDAIGVLQRLLRRSRPPLVRAKLLHGLGELYEATGDHAEAFTSHQQANRSRSAVFSPEDFRHQVDELIEVFDGVNFPLTPMAANPTRTPVLIVGMPRSGTTLVEQILASHSNVMGAGELEELQILARAMPELLGTNRPYPQCVHDLNPNIATHLSTWYTERMMAKTGDATRITDKMPLNFLHLGLAALLLPNARIVHCRRGAMDTALSCYFMHFKDSYAFSTDLRWLGQFYVEYDRLMQHWQRVLPLPILDVQYEEMVSYPDETMRRVIDFVGLPWDPTCERFYDNERHVASASSEQVRQPIYTTSVGRYRPYEEHLAPFREELEKAGIPLDTIRSLLH